MADTLRNKASARYSEAKTKASDAYAKGKDKAGEAARTAKAKAEKAAASTKVGARKAASTTAAQVETNPLAAIVGGLAVGAIVAALLPRTAREDKIAGDVGRKVRSTAKTAARNARETAKEQLDALGVNADSARDQLRDLVGKVTEAARSAGNAAADTVRKP